MSPSRILLILVGLAIAVPTIAPAREKSAPLPKFEAWIAEPAPPPGVLNSSAVQGTSYFGGTTWNADSTRWEAIQDSVWTFDSGVGSHFDHNAPYVNPFKDPTLHASMEGWMGIDNSYSELPFFRRFAEADFAAGDTCVGASAGLGGSYSLWAGVLAAEADSLCYADGQGYGENWFVCVERTFAYAGSDSVLFEYDFANDTEPGFDFTYVLVDTSGNGDTVEIAAYSGNQSGHAAHTLFVGAELPTGPGAITLKFCLASDGAYSDQDGNHPTVCGGFAVDDISVTEGATVIVSDFETGDDGWMLSPAEPGRGGEWSDIVSLNDLPPVQTPGGCVCDLQDSVLVFEDLVAGGHGIYQDNMAASPWVDLKAAGRQAPGKFLEASYNVDLPLLNYIFIQTPVQWYPQICSATGKQVVSPWTSGGFVTFFGPGLSGCNAAGFPLRRNFGFFVDASAERVRIALGVISYCRFFANCNGITNSTPWFDNVRVGVFGNQSAPLLSTSTIDVPQDAFPEDGTLSLYSPGRLDVNNVKGETSPEPGSALGDTMVVEGGTGGAEVWVEFAVTPGPGIQLSNLIDWLGQNHFVGTRDGQDWFEARLDTAENGGLASAAGTWMTTYHEESPGFSGSDTDLDPGDLYPNGSMGRLANDMFPDDLFTPGTRVNLFFKTRFLGGSDWFTDPDTSLGTGLDGDKYHEFEVLPSSMAADSSFNCVLYVDHFSGRGAQPIIEEALSSVLPAGSANFENTAWDRWDVQAPTSQQASFGRPLNTEYGATVQQALGYNTILWNSGNLGAFTLVKEDAEVIIPWLSLNGFGEKSLYLSGDGIAASMTLESASEPSALRLLEDYLGVFYSCNTYRQQDCPAGSIEDTTACIDVDPVTGAPVATRPLGGNPLGQGNGCNEYRSFDVITPNSSPLYGVAQADEEYRSAIKSAQYASVATAAAGQVAYKSMVDGLSLHYRRDPGACAVHTASPPVAVEERLREALTWFGVTGTEQCSDGSVLVGQLDTPLVHQTQLLPVTPNPMRAGRTARIAFSTAERSRVTVDVFDTRGRRMRTLIEDVLDAGDHEAFWDGTDETHRTVASGVYFYRLTTEGKEISRKMVVVRGR